MIYKYSNMAQNRNRLTGKFSGLLAVLLVITSAAARAQTGPGGVGNADGSDGQPENVLWLDANTLSLSGGADVTTWADKSGNGYVFGASTSGNLPSFESDGGSTINGFPVVRFVGGVGGNAERLVVNPFNGFPSSDITTIIVFKTNEGGEGIVSYAVSGNSNEYLIYDAEAIKTYVDNSSFAGGDFSTPSNTANIFSSRWTNVGGTVDHYKDGLQVRTGTIANGVFDH